MKRFFLFITITLVWIYIVSLFKNMKMHFLKFAVGTIGFFMISMVFFLPYLEGKLNNLISYTFIIVERQTGYFEVFEENSIISIDTKSGPISILINFECSGVVEMLVFTSLAAFFPFGTKVRKIFSIILGNIYIYIANIVRVLFIIFVTKTFGAEAFNFVHTILARILFFMLMIILYYFVFTTTHLKYQSVGEIK